MKKLITILVIALMSLSCTEQIQTKTFGGSMTVELPKGKRLVIATWKDNNLWYLTRDFKEGEEATVFEFTESSSFGQFEGTIIFKETNND